MNYINSKVGVVTDCLDGNADDDEKSVPYVMIMNIVMMMLTIIA